MTGLLVSVRSGAEAASALAGGAAVIDIKEPARGSLGPAGPAVWREVCRQVGDECPVSAALGELLHDRPGERLADLAQMRWAKIGLAACGQLPDWHQRWGEIVDRFPDSVGAVAVIYADHDRAAAPDPEEILTRAVAVGCSTLLLDTFDKSQGGLFDILPSSRVGQIVQAARDLSLCVVLGGSLNQSSIDLALAWKPDLVAVRGAACQGDRTGCIDRQRVRLLAERVAGAETVRR